MVKASRSDKLPVPSNAWIDENDEKLLRLSSKHGTGLRRTGKSSRQRWSNHQKNDHSHESFTPEEEELIIKLHATIGSRWPIIAQQLHGRTDNEVKILWNSKLKKKLFAMGIDPVTHKPFSKILEDYGNIGAFPKARPRFNSLERELRNTIVVKSNQNPDKFFNPNSPSTTANNVLAQDHSLDLYSQFQAINLVKNEQNHIDSEIIRINCTTEYGSSSTYPCSSGTSQSTTSFNWSDFLHEGAFLNANTEEQENVVMLSENSVNAEEKPNFGADEDHNIMESSSYGLELSSSSNVSFVEAMFQKEDDMLAYFPGLSEEPLYY